MQIPDFQAMIVTKRVMRWLKQKEVKPKIIVTDQERQFIRVEWKKVHEILDIFLMTTSPQNPQVNAAERVMKEIGRACRDFRYIGKKMANDTEALLICARQY